MPDSGSVSSAAGDPQEPKVASPEVARGVYSQREAFLAKREAEGELSFRYVENNGTPDNDMWWAPGVMPPLQMVMQHLSRAFDCTAVLSSCCVCSWALVRHALQQTSVVHEGETEKGSLLQIHPSG